MKSNFKDGEPLKTVRETAIRLRASIRTVWRLVDKGKLPPPIRVGREACFYQSDIEDYLRKLREGS